MGSGRVRRSTARGVEERVHARTPGRCSLKLPVSIDCACVQYQRGRRMDLSIDLLRNDLEKLLGKFGLARRAHIASKVNAAGSLCLCVIIREGYPGEWAAREREQR